MMPIALERMTTCLVMALLLNGTRAQCDEQVTHLIGTQLVGVTSIAVSVTGTTDSDSGYCTETFPYFIGYNYTTNTSATGSYTFQFNPPIDSATFNVSGISQDVSNAEEVWLYVNGAHYTIPVPGLPQACDPMAVLTPNGDIAACSNCSVSGWGGTTIPGPITTLTVLDTVLMGMPAGSIFSLFICADHGTGAQDATTMQHASPYPNPARDVLFIDLRDVLNTHVRLFDASGRRVAITTSVVANRMSIFTAGLPSGIYALQVQQDAQLMVHQVVVE